MLNLGATCALHMCYDMAHQGDGIIEVANMHAIHMSKRGNSDLVRMYLITGQFFFPFHVGLNHSCVTRRPT